MMEVSVLHRLTGNNNKYLACKGELFYSSGSLWLLIRENVHVLFIGSVLLLFSGCILPSGSLTWVCSFCIRGMSTYAPWECSKWYKAIENSTSW